ncbi:MAG: alpha/beta fold hydrolase [Pseudohongiellaceae bacterium]
MTIELQGKKFQPSVWLPNGHLQTLWRKFSAVSPLSLLRQRIELADGDFIDLDWSATNEELIKTDKPIVLLVHGLCGSSASGYVRSMQVCLTKFGFPAVALNFRGCSGEPNRLARAYHSGVSEDLQEVFARLQAAYPQKEFALVGYSLGANVTLKWLGESNPQQVRCAIAVSTPFSLAYCSESMKKGLGKYYGRFFLKRLVSVTEYKKQELRERGRQDQVEILESCGDLNRLSSLWDFDDQVTAPLHGFADAEDYYEQCSSNRFLPLISTPTLLIQSLDDPIIPAGALPTGPGLNNNIHVEISGQGGHVGFISRHDRYWLEHRIIRFIESWE